MLFRRDIRKRLEAKYGGWLAEFLVKMSSMERERNLRKLNEFTSEYLTKHGHQLSKNDLDTYLVWFMEGHTLASRIFEKCEDIDIQPLSAKLEEAQRVILRSYLIKCAPDSVPFELITSIVLWRIWRIIDNMKNAGIPDQDVNVIMGLYDTVTLLFHKYANDHGVDICITDYLFSRNHQRFHKPHEASALECLSH